MEDLKCTKFNTVEEQVIPPRGFYARHIYKGQVIRITDLEGQQVPDFICFNRYNHVEKISVNNTLLINGNIYATTGHVLYSTHCNPMFTIINDTCGRHDLICGSCSEYSNALRYKVRGTPNCRDNMISALAPYGVCEAEIPYSFNIFMNCPVSLDGSISIQEPISKPGDFIELQAEMDCLIAISNCPQERNPCNAFNPTALAVLVYDPIA
ncbi:MAG: urea carboxylase-associated family protein [Syntrophomonadaceae bacterium]|jgi:urea carboxylase-associated protein 1|nr:urea carboxylase-associated family protein [Syntrophomonadaceae bacterium]